MKHWHLSILIASSFLASLGVMGGMFGSRSAPSAEAFTPPASGLYLAVDCDTSAGGVQDTCAIQPAATSRDVAVVFGNVDVAGESVKAFQFTVRADQTSFNPRPGADTNLNGNPDFNDAAFQSGWNCGIIPPEPDRNPDPAVAESTIYCFRGGGGVDVPAGTTLTLATVRYDALGARTSDFELLDVVIGNSQDVEILSCNPPSDAPGPCFPARIAPPPTPTNTVPPTATPTMTPTTVLPTSTPTADASSGVFVAVDCNTAASGVQNDCAIQPSVTSRDVAVVFGNVDVAGESVKAFQFTVRADQTSFNPRPGADTNLNGNPDFNDAAFQSGWNCGIIPPEPDRNPDPAVAESTIYCFRGGGGVDVPAGTTLTLATVRYDALGARTSDFELLDVVVGNSQDVEILSCNPPADAPGPCFPARIGPAATPTNTPTPPAGATATPTDEPTITPTASLTPTATLAPPIDIDGDGMSDVYELSHPCLSILEPDGDVDHDTDGLTSLQESVLLTDACAADSDLDEMPDGFEAQFACISPLVPDAMLDADADTLSNNDERLLGTSPCNADTDGDGYNDGAEVQIEEDPTLYCSIMRADVNNSGSVNVIDLFATAREAGPVPPGNPRMNQTNDGRIDVIDLFRIAQVANRSVSACD